MKNNFFMVAMILCHHSCGLGVQQSSEIELNMQAQNRAIAQEYYTAMAEKNIAEVAQYLDEDVEFIAPLVQLSGKKEFLGRVTEFCACFETLTIRSIFGSQDQAAVFFTVDYPAPINTVDFVALLHITDTLITNIELFYDGRVF